MASVTGMPYIEAAEPAAPPPRVGVGARTTLAPFTFPTVGVTKATVLAVPTLQRAHDLIVSLVAGLPIVPYRATWNAPAGELESTPVQPLPWHNRPDPIRTRAAFLGAIASDLWAHGVAYARVTSRYQDTDRRPASFQWMPFELVNVTYPSHSPAVCGLVPGSTVTYAGVEVPYADVVEFSSPVTGVCEVAWRAIQTATELEQAALRFAGSEVPAGWLKQTGGDDMTGDELAEQASTWTEARRTNTTAALNPYMDYFESSFDPSRMQLVEARTYQALELARVGNVPPYMVGAPAGTGMTYLNAETARVDLVDFGAAPIIDTIEQTLSGPAISPAGQYIVLDTAEWLSNPFTDTAPAPAPDTSEVSP
jgi:phage portal protein BeeE